MTKNEALKLKLALDTASYALYKATPHFDTHKMIKQVEDAIATINKYLAAPVQEPVNWSVYNSGAEVTSGLTFSEAWDYLTPERLARQWCAVCVVDQSSMPATPPAAPVQEPVAWLEILRNNKTATDEVIGAYLRGHAEHVTGETFVLTDTAPAAQPAPVQEPVGKVIASVPHLRSISVELLPEAPVPSEDSLIYTTPPAAQRQWVGLTGEERSECVNTPFVSQQWANIEAKLKEKNYGKW